MGDWLFTGAAEQSPEGFNRGWFVGNASTAIQDDRRRAIYASSFKKTGLTFPMTWARNADYVNAVNVTDRYTSGAKPEVVTGLRLMLDVFDRPVGKRMTAKVTVTDAANQTVRFEGIRFLHRIYLSADQESPAPVYAFRRCRSQQKVHHGLFTWRLWCVCYRTQDT